MLTTRPSWPRTTTRSDSPNVNVGRNDRSIHWMRRPRGMASRSVLDRGLIGVVGGLIVVEVAAHVLDVEAGLVAGVEPLDQLLEGRLPGDDDELVARWPSAGHSAGREVGGDPAPVAAVEQGGEDLGGDGQVADPARRSGPARSGPGPGPSAGSIAA